MSIYGTHRGQRVMQLNQLGWQDKISSNNKHKIFFIYIKLTHNFKLNKIFR